MDYCIVINACDGSCKRGSRDKPSSHKAKCWVYYPANPIGKIPRYSVFHREAESLATFIHLKTSLVNLGIVMELWPLRKSEWVLETQIFFPDRRCRGRKSGFCRFGLGETPVPSVWFQRFLGCHYFDITDCQMDFIFPIHRRKIMEFKCSKRTFKVKDTWKGPGFV